MACRRSTSARESTAKARCCQPTRPCRCGPLPASRAGRRISSSSPLYHDTPLSASSRVQPSACITGSNCAIERGRSSTLMPRWSKSGIQTSYGPRFGPAEVTENRSMTEPAEFVDRTLQAEGTEGRADADADRIGVGLKFYGASVGAVRGAVRDADRRYPGMSHDEVTALASEPVYERRLAAIVLLQRFLAVLQGSDLTRVEQFLRDARVLELVDPLAIDVVRPLLDRLEEPDATRARRIIDRWSGSDDQNLRRAAGLL